MQRRSGSGRKRFGIGYRCAFDHSPGSHDVGLLRCPAHDVHDLNPAYEQRIADQRPVAPPGERLGAHDCSRLLLGQYDQFP